MPAAGAGAEGDFSLDFKTGGGRERRKPKHARSAEIVNDRDFFTAMLSAVCECCDHAQSQAAGAG